MEFWLQHTVRDHRGPDIPGRRPRRMRRITTHRLRDLIGVAVLPNHSGIGDGWSGGVNLLGAI